MTTTRRALLGLGSNMGDRVEYLRAAVAAIPDVVAVSDAYETDPVGGVEQDPFLNVVVELDTARTPHELLEVCRERERDAERVRTVRWGRAPSMSTCCGSTARPSMIRRNSSSRIRGCSSAPSCWCPWPTSRPMSCPTATTS